VHEKKKKVQQETPVLHEIVHASTGPVSCATWMNHFAPFVGISSCQCNALRDLADLQFSRTTERASYLELFLQPDLLSKIYTLKPPPLKTLLEILNLL